MRGVQLAAAVVSIAGLAFTVPAQNQPQSQPQPSPAPANAQPGGPTAPAAQPSNRLTIVERDAQGQFKHLAMPAEERAIQVMDLAPDERQRAEKVIAERAQVLDEIVLKNFALLQRMHDATIAGDAAKARELSGRFLLKLERLTDRGRFEDELRPQLRLDHQEEFTRLITEYRQALLQEGTREARAANQDMKPQQIADREMRRAMAREVQRAYQRTIVGTPVDYDALLPKLGLKPEQESKVRNLATEFTQQHKEPTEDQRRDLLMKVLADLDDAQRLALINAIRGRAG